MKSQHTVGEAVHLLDEQNLEDLLGAHHPLAARIRIAKTADEIGMDKVEYLGTPGQKFWIW